MKKEQQSMVVSVEQQIMQLSDKMIGEYIYEKYKKWFPHRSDCKITGVMKVDNLVDGGANIKVIFEALNRQWEVRRAYRQRNWNNWRNREDLQ